MLDQNIACNHISWEREGVATLRRNNVALKLLSAGGKANLCPAAALRVCKNTRLPLKQGRKTVCHCFGVTDFWNFGRFLETYSSSEVKSGKPSFKIHTVLFISLFNPKCQSSTMFMAATVTGKLRQMRCDWLSTV